ASTMLSEDGVKAYDTPHTVRLKSRYKIGLSRVHAILCHNSFFFFKQKTAYEIVIRVGRYGPYLQRGDDRASIPEDLPPDELTLEKASELLSAPSGDRVLGADAEGTPVIARVGRYGPYVQLGDPDGN